VALRVRQQRGIVVDYKGSGVVFDPTANPHSYPVFVSHAHADHAAAFKYPERLKYATEETYKLLYSLGWKHLDNWQKIKIGDKIKIDDIEVRIHNAGHVLGSVEFEVNTPEGTVLYTGDIGKMDEEGYFYIVDRKKDMVIAGGYNIYPREIDEILFEHPKILEACAVGIPDPYRGETIKAFVVLKPGETMTGEEVIKYCGEKLAKYKVPKMVEFMSSLPKSMVGKILRKELRAMEMAKGKK
jgi:acyl-CoA synthetase (AMP-forming)/AMP-acid ligase II